MQSYNSHGIENINRESEWRSWKRLGLPIMLLADRVPARPNQKKSLQQAVTLILLSFSDRNLNLEVPCTIIILLMIHFCPLHIEQVLKLLGAVRPDVLHKTSLQITLTVPEVVDTENGVTSNLPLLLYPSRITKMQSQSLVTDS